MFDFVDKIVYINLAHREDRNLSILAELSLANTFIKTDELLATCRQYVAFNDFYFEEAKTEIKDNSIQIIENLNKALAGESVEEYYFILALSELLPKMKCSYNIKERKIIEFFENRNIDTEGSIYFTDKIDESKIFIEPEYFKPNQRAVRLSEDFEHNAKTKSIEVEKINFKP
jgi:hypothetical protein